MVEDDGAEVSAVVVGDEVLRGVGALEASRPHTLVLQQGLVQGEQDLWGRREGKVELAARRQRTQRSVSNSCCPDPSPNPLVLGSPLEYLYLYMLFPMNIGIST